MLKDLVYAVRNMARNPGLSAVAVLTLALGIGANTAMFSILNAVLLRPLPYKEPGRLVTILGRIPSLRIEGAHVEYNTFAEWWRAQSKSFDAMWAYNPATVNITSGGEPERLEMRRVNAGFLSMMAYVRPWGVIFCRRRIAPAHARRHPQRRTLEAALCVQSRCDRQFRGVG